MEKVKASKECILQAFFDLAAEYRYESGYRGGYADWRLLKCTKCSGWHRKKIGCLDDGESDNCSWQFCPGHVFFDGWKYDEFSDSHKEDLLRTVREARKCIKEGKEPTLWGKEAMQRFCSRNFCTLCEAIHSKMEGCVANGSEADKLKAKSDWLSFLGERRRAPRKEKKQKEFGKTREEIEQMSLEDIGRSIIESLEKRETNIQRPRKQPIGRAILGRAVELNMCFPCWKPCRSM